MILTCPECATSYEAPSELLGPTGRKVKCHKCGHIWLASPDEIEDFETLSAADPEADNDEIEFDDLIVRSAGSGGDEDAPTEAGEQTDTQAMLDAAMSDFDGEPEADDGNGDAASNTGDPANSEAGDSAGVADVESTASLQRLRDWSVATSNHPTVSRVRRICAIAASLVLLLGGLYALRYQVVRYAPGSAQLYALVGFDINLRGLEFRDIVYAREFEDGIPVLAVRGEIVNVTDSPVLLPTIRFSLRDSGAQEVYYWTARAGPELLAPSGVVPFESRLASPPAGAREIMVRFAGR